MIVELHAEVEKWRKLTELQCQDNREVAKLDEENQLLRKLVKIWQDQLKMLMLLDI